MARRTGLSWARRAAARPGYRWYALGLTAVAWVQFLGGVGSLAGPPIFGYLVDSTDSYRIAWLATALPVVLGLVAILRLREGPGGGR
jgi:MFS family permease